MGSRSRPCTVTAATSAPATGSSWSRRASAARHASIKSPSAWSATVPPNTARTTAAHASAGIDADPPQYVTSAANPAVYERSAMVVPIGRHGLNAAAIALIAVIRPTAFATASDGNHLRSTMSPERTLTVEAPAIAAAVYEVSNGARTPD